MNHCPRRLQPVNRGQQNAYTYIFPKTTPTMKATNFSWKWPPEHICPLCRTMTTVVRLHKKSLEKHAHSLPFLVRQQTTSPSTHLWHTGTMTRTANPQNYFIPTDKPKKNHFPMLYPYFSLIWSSWKRRRLSAAYSLFRKSWQLGFFGLIQIWQKVFTGGFPPLFLLVFALHGL